MDPLSFSRELGVFLNAFTSNKHLGTTLTESAEQIVYHSAGVSDICRIGSLDHKTCKNYWQATTPDSTSDPSRFCTDYVIYVISKIKEFGFGNSIAHAGLEVFDRINETTCAPMGDQILKHALYAEIPFDPLLVDKKTVRDYFLPAKPAPRYHLLESQSRSTGVRLEEYSRIVLAIVDLLDPDIVGQVATNWISVAPELSEHLHKTDGNYWWDRVKVEFGQEMDSYSLFFTNISREVMNKRRVPVEVLHSCYSEFLERIDSSSSSPNLLKPFRGTGFEIGVHGFHLERWLAKQRGFDPESIDNKDMSEFERNLERWSRRLVEEANELYKKPKRLVENVEEHVNRKAKDVKRFIGRLSPF